MSIPMDVAAHAADLADKFGAMIDAAPEAPEPITGTARAARNVSFTTGPLKADL